MNEENVVCFGTREYGRSYVQALNEIKNLKQQLKDKDEKINKIEKLTKQLKGSARYERCMDELDNILEILESNKEE